MNSRHSNRHAFDVRLDITKQPNFLFRYKNPDKNRFLNNLSGDGMAHIQKIKRKRGIAHQVFYNVDGIRKTKYFSISIPYREVKKFAKEIEYQSNHKQTNLILNKVTLEEFLQIYAQRRASEVDPWREILSIKGLIKHLGQDHLIQAIDHHVIHQYRDCILSNRLANLVNDDFVEIQRIRRGVNKELCFLRVVFRWAYKNDLISLSIFDKVSMLKTSKPIPDILTKEEDRAYYQAVKMLDDRILRIAYWILKYAGVRRSELIELRWKDLDVDKGYIKLSKTKNMDEEIIPMHPKLNRVLRWIKRGEPDELVIPYKRDRITRHFRKALEYANLGYKKSPVHILRHSLGARIIEHDLSDKGERMAQEILRHKTKAMTKYYTKVTKENLKSKLSDINF